VALRPLNLLQDPLLHRQEEREQRDTAKLQPKINVAIGGTFGSLRSTLHLSHILDFWTVEPAHLDFHSVNRKDTGARKWSDIGFFL